MDLFIAQDYLGAQKEFIMISEKNKNNSNKTNELQKFMTEIIYKNCQTEESLKWLNEQVAAGNSYAQDHLGEIYFRSYEGKYAIAFELYKLSADQGNSHAQYDLSYMYEFGYGCEKNMLKALELLIESIDKGCFDARHFLEKTINKKHSALYDLYSKSKKLEEETEAYKHKIKELEEENEKLKIEIEYRPGGDGYEKAKENFSSLKNLTA